MKLAQCYLHFRTLLTLVFLLGGSGLGLVHIFGIANSCQKSATTSCRYFGLIESKIAYPNDLDQALRELASFSGLFLITYIPLLVLTRYGLTRYALWVLANYSK